MITSSSSYLIFFPHPSGLKRIKIISPFPNTRNSFIHGVSYPKTFSHRHAWQQEEKWLLHQIHGSTKEIAHLRARVEELEHLERDLRAKVQDLKREVGERDNMLNFMTRPPPPPSLCSTSLDNISSKTFKPSSGIPCFTYPSVQETTSLTQLSSNTWRASSKQALSPSKWINPLSRLNNESVS